MADQATLQTMSQKATLGMPLQMVLAEVVALYPKILTWTTVPTSGSAVCHYDKDGKATGYDIRYQIGNMGNMVHELIHVAVNEAYGLDFVNYANPAAKPPDRTYDSVGRCTNEDVRQTKSMSDAGNKTAGDSLAALSRWANAAMELTLQQRTDIVAKFGYGQQWPMKEYDTVITQVLVWLHEWKYPKPAVAGLKR